MKKIITYGTFDLFHQGHYNILKRARALGDYLIVGVTSESYDIERGKLNVRDGLITRIENVMKTGFADEIIIEEYQGQKVNDIIKYQADALVVGSDWRGKFDYLKNYCDVIYLERTKNISSTQIRETNDVMNRLGIATDKLDDWGVILESKYVSGVHCENVYSKDLELARAFYEKYDLNGYVSDYDEFLKDVEIVYINTGYEERYNLVLKAVQNKKSVICSAPITNDAEKLAYLFKLAKKNKTVICEDVITVYLRAFTQLVWLINSSLIGRVISVKCSISRGRLAADMDFQNMLMYPFCAIIKLLGKDYKNISCSVVRNQEGEALYHMINVNYDNAIAVIEVGNKVDVDDNMEIIGDKGKISIPDDWWNTGYFETKLTDSSTPKRYSFNFDGNGFRYLLQELMIMKKDRRYESTRIFNEESLKIVEMINAVCEEDK
ncbi:MAG: adenylyltransferase/cytidyltransferase family protein [Butyrivibrio sp.]